MVWLTGCNGSPPTAALAPSATAGPAYAFNFPSAPIASVALDDYARGGTLTMPAGTGFGLQLAGGGWTFPSPGHDDPFTVVRGPGNWTPDGGFAGPGNCASTGPCGGNGIVLKSARSGYGDVFAVNDKSVFDLHVVVKPGPITLDLQAQPIITEDMGTTVSMPVGSTVNVHFIGDWGSPTPDSAANSLYFEDGIKAWGVVKIAGSTKAFDETVYSFSILGKGGFSYHFQYLDRAPFSNGYTIDFDIH